MKKVTKLLLFFHRIIKILNLIEKQILKNKII